MLEIRHPGRFPAEFPILYRRTQQDDYARHSNQCTCGCLPVFGCPVCLSLLDTAGEDWQCHHCQRLWPKSYVTEWAGAPYSLADIYPTHYRKLEPEPCFACGKPMRHESHQHEVDTRDDQKVLVGPDCFKHVKRAGEAGYQPPTGGPRLYLLPEAP